MIAASRAHSSTPCKQRSRRRPISASAPWPRTKPSEPRFEARTGRREHCFEVGADQSPRRSEDPVVPVPMRTDLRDRATVHRCVEMGVDGERESCRRLSRKGAEDVPGEIGLAIDGESDRYIPVSTLGSSRTVPRKQRKDVAERPPMSSTLMVTVSTAPSAAPTDACPPRWSHRGGEARSCSGISRTGAAPDLLLEGLLQFVQERWGDRSNLKLLRGGGQ